MMSFAICIKGSISSSKSSSRSSSSSSSCCCCCCLVVVVVVVVSWWHSLVLKCEVDHVARRVLCEGDD